MQTTSDNNIKSALTLKDIKTSSILRIKTLFKQHPHLRPQILTLYRFEELDLQITEQSATGLFLDKDLYINQNKDKSNYNIRSVYSMLRIKNINKILITLTKLANYLNGDNLPIDHTSNTIYGIVQIGTKFKVSKISSPIEAFLFVTFNTYNGALAALTLLEPELKPFITSINNYKNTNKDETI